MKYYVSDREFSYPKITTKPTENSAVYATLADAIRDSEQWRNGHYSDGECIDLIMNWVEQLDDEKEVDDYIKKEEYVGLYAEWADNDTDEDRREDIESELRDLYNELVVDYGDIKPYTLYEKLSEEITK